jgi:cupin superfamily acireductone dioxygenase involved in methionine salvage
MLVSVLYRLRVFIFALYKLDDEDIQLSVEWPDALQICQNTSHYFGE